MILLTFSPKRWVAMGIRTGRPSGDVHAHLPGSRHGDVCSFQNRSRLHAAPGKDLPAGNRAPPPGKPMPRSFSSMTGTRAAARSPAQKEFTRRS